MFASFFAVSCQSAFADDEPFDFVINLAAETKMGQSDAVSMAMYFLLLETRLYVEEGRNAKTEQRAMILKK